MSVSCGASARIHKTLCTTLYAGDATGFTPPPASGFHGPPLHDRLTLSAFLLWAFGRYDDIGLLLVLALLTFLGYQAVVVRNDGPELRTSVVRVEETISGQYIVHYKVANDGGMTAASVTVVGELVRNGQQLER